MRALIPMTFLLIVGFAFGVHFPGIDGLLIALVLATGFAAVAASWGSTLALRFKTQSAAPLMQAGIFMAVLFTASYAPLALLTGWLHTVATYNPVPVHHRRGPPGLRRRPHLGHAPGRACWRSPGLRS